MNLRAAEQSDEQLLLALKEGSEQALHKLFMRYYDALVRFAVPILKDQDAARDVVQEVFARIWEKRAALADETRIKSYLYMAVKNQSINVLRKEERIQWMNEESEMEALAPREESTFNTMVDRDLQVRLKHALSAIPPKCRQVFELSRFEGLSYQQIADTLEISVKTVENQMTKALQIMRKELLPYLKVVLFCLIWQ
ncbi:MAG: RNA polymerase sigma-70 factor [Bacteroidetes bacterium]|nr:MAG: RNA polymerase sigma-70 factor [Bacteroidota bacterium]